MSNFYILMDAIRDERIRNEKNRVYPTREETIQAEAIAVGRECKGQQRQGIIPRHDGSSCYACEQFEKARGG